MKEKIYVRISHHFDLMWRRPFRERFVVEGQQFVSYADLEAMYLEKQMEFAENDPAYRFQIESPAVAQTYLQEHPDQSRRLHGLIDRGQASVGGTGYCIIDGNLCGGETLVHNYLLENRWRKREGIAPSVQALRTDAFGNPAQLPQILRGFQYDWVSDLCYVPITKDYWRGLDGTVIATAAPAFGGSLMSTVKYAPCPACRGFGTADGKTCPICGGSCVDQERAKKYPAAMMLAESDRLPGSVIHAASEELIPSAEELQQIYDLKERYEVVFAGPEILYDLCREKIEAVDEPHGPEEVFAGELNPACTGCYVTQIAAKQQARYFENQLLINELLQAMVLMSGRQPEDDTALWELLLYQFFHDAVTGTHINAAHRELQACWKRLEKLLLQQRKKALQPFFREQEGYSVWNPGCLPYTGLVELPLETLPRKCRITRGDAEVRPVEPCLVEGTPHVRFLVKNLGAYEAVTFVPEGAAVCREPETADGLQIENERFRIRADQQGLLEIYDKKLGKPLSIRGTYRPLEWICTADAGSPWATIHADQRAYHIGKQARLRKAEKTEIFERLEYEISELPLEQSGCFGSLQLVWDVTLYRGVERIELSADVDWNEYENRLRLVLPLPFRGRHLYEVPFGVMERKPYTPTYHWTGANGDYPAGNWAGVESPEISVAVFNQGTPSYCIREENDGSLLAVSVLRSPCMPAFLQEERYVTMKEWDCIRDQGRHRFRLAVSAYDRPFAGTPVVGEAAAWSRGLLKIPGGLQFPAMPMVEGTGVCVTAMKPAENGNGIVVRLLETTGKPQTAVVLLPSGVRACEKLRLDETPVEPLQMERQRLSVNLRPFEAVTLRLLPEKDLQRP